MVFIIVTILLWIVFVLLMLKRKQQEFRFHEVLIPLILFSLLVTVDLGINFVASAIPSINDGIGIHTFLAKWIIPDDGWSVSLFRSYFHGSLIVSFILLLIYPILKLIER